MDAVTVTSLEDVAPVLQQYTNYREYLRDYYQFRRNQHRSDFRAYSYAMFAAAANIRSPNYLKLVIEGERNLSEVMAQKFAQAMNLNKAEQVEFWLLVRYNQEIDPPLRNQFLKELCDYRIERQLHQGAINEQTWEKVPNWVAWVLQAMVDQEGVQFDHKKLHDLLSSEIQLGLVEAAFKSLLQTGDIAVDAETGEGKKTRALTDSAENIPVELVRKIQSELIYLGLESLFRDSATEREFGSTTLALTESEFQNIRFELRQLRKRLHRDIASKRQSSKGERIYQLNIQFFPVTKKAKKKCVDR